MHRPLNGRVEFIDEPDTTFSPVGVKSAAEVVMVGVAAAMANAVDHTTGGRHRRLPIRVGDVLATLADPHEPVTAAPAGH